MLSQPALLETEDGRVLMVMGDTQRPGGLVYLRLLRGGAGKDLYGNFLELSFWPLPDLWGRLKVAWAVLRNRPVVSNLWLTQASSERIAEWFGTAPGQTADPADIHRRAHEIINQLGKS